MRNNKMLPIVIIVIVAIIAIIGIIFIEKTSKASKVIDVYIGKINTTFENKLISNYSELKKFKREYSLETLRKNHQNYNVLDIFNEEFFENKKVAVINIYEDNAKDYDYHVDKIKYNDDKTIATIEYTDKSSGFNGPVASSWINCVMIELDHTVTDVQFIKAEE